MRLRVLAIVLLGVVASTVAPGRAMAAGEPVAPDTLPPVTVNEFLPEDRSLGECISAVPKPGCGSDARGGWRQGLVLVAILAGLTLITWRIVATARRARREQLPTT